MSKREVLSHFSIKKETAHRIQANIVNSSKTMSYMFMVLIIIAFGTVCSIVFCYSTFSIMRKAKRLQIVTFFVL